MIAGFIFEVNGVAHNNVARLSSDGELDSTFVKPNVDRTVISMALQNDGKILIGGFFTSVNGVARNTIARLNANGTLDTGFNPIIGGGFGTDVSEIVIQDGGKILIGGSFNEVDGVSRTSLARLNSNGTLDTGFNPLLERSNGLTPKVDSIALQNDGKIVISGLFDIANGEARQNFARLNSNGTLDTGFNVNLDGAALHIVVQRDNKIMIGGTFNQVNGAARRYIARVNSNGTLDTAFNPSPNDFVSTIIQITESFNFIGGGFTRVGGFDRPYLASLIFKQDEEFCVPIKTAAGSVAVVCL